MKDKTLKENLIFLHIPKTGGSTLNHILKSQYGVYELITVTANKYPGKMYLELLKDKSLKSKQKVIRGHMSFGLHTDFSKTSEYITIIRNPVDRILSLYYYLLRKKNKLYVNLSLKNFVNNNFNYNLFSFNIQTRLISGMKVNWHDDKSSNFSSVTNKDLVRAKRNLENHFSVVGVTDFFDEFLFMLKERFSWENVFYVKKNCNKNAKVQYSNVSKDIIKDIRKNNKFDMELYDFARYKIQRKINEFNNIKKEEIKNFKNNIKSYIKVNLFDSYKDFISLSLLKYMFNSTNEDVAIFGTEEHGLSVYNFIDEVNKRISCNIKVKFFIDNNEKNWGGTINNKPVYKPNISHLKKVSKIIIASLNRREIILQLYKLGVEEKNIINSF